MSIHPVEVQQPNLHPRTTIRVVQVHDFREVPPEEQTRGGNLE
jgi:hypothetical protein